MDLNLTGYFWGMPIDLIGQISDQPWYNSPLVIWSLSLLVSVFSGISTYYLTTDFSPKVHLRIIPTWISENLVIIGLEIENFSKVTSFSSKDEKDIRISYRVDEIKADKINQNNPDLSEWVDFKNPVQIFTTTRTILPGEIVSGERLYFCPTGSILKVGLQMRLKTNYWFGFIANKGKPVPEQWTTTKIIANKLYKIQIASAFADI